MTTPTPLPAFEDIGILVTGGTGSFGKALVKHITTHFRPRRLVVFSRDEMKQYEMSQAFPDSKFPYLRYFIGDVRDTERLEIALRGIDVVIHAAALKHVPIAEYNPFECIHTNVLGAENVVRAALRARVKRVIALSTDKAANPINLYGASKLAADKIFIAANVLAGDMGTRFSVVRYGNVLGSRGSVVPFFRRLVAENAPSIPITDPRMTRFWITLDQGIKFVLSCMHEMIGGEIFVPRCPSIRIVDLAQAIAPNISQHVVGIRPGEKLHEVLITDDDARLTWKNEGQYVILPAGWDHLSEHYLRHGLKPIGEAFSYTSDNNSWWLEGKDITRFLELAGA